MSTGGIKQPRGGGAASGKTHDDDVGVFVLHAHHYRSFNVLKLSRASRMAMIQRRTTTFGSSHPFISK
jgi:hypothetical protein